MERFFDFMKSSSKVNNEFLLYFIIHTILQDLLFYLVSLCSTIFSCFDYFIFYSYSSFQRKVEPQRGMRLFLFHLLMRKLRPRNNWSCISNPILEALLCQNLTGVQVYITLNLREELNVKDT